MKAETKDLMLFFSKALQRFEFCFELGWKLIKKMLMDVEGIEA